jgi:hypothetical protein
MGPQNGGGGAGKPAGGGPPLLGDLTPPGLRSCPIASIRILSATLEHLYTLLLNGIYSFATSQRYVEQARCARHTRTPHTLPLPCRACASLPGARLAPGAAITTPRPTQGAAHAARLLLCTGASPHFHARAAGRSVGQRHWLCWWHQNAVCSWALKTHTLCFPFRHIASTQAPRTEAITSSRAIGRTSKSAALHKAPAIFGRRPRTGGGAQRCAGRTNRLHHGHSGGATPAPRGCRRCDALP